MIIKTTISKQVALNKPHSNRQTQLAGCLLSTFLFKARLPKFILKISLPNFSFWLEYGAE